ncbi:MAG: metallophosphoesterase [bacterium]|nr:metallophosphoesterase [bacterium]
MKIAIISDTHGNVANFKKVVNWLKKEKIDTILHCGDIGDSESLKESLINFDGEFLGVLGNMDKDFKIELKEYQNSRTRVMEEVLETEFGGKKIAVIHKPDQAEKLAETGKYDLVFYGHTHRPWEDKIGNCRVINPGELAGQINKPTFAIYDTDADELELKILEKIN